MKNIILIIFCFTLPLLVHAQKEIGTTTIYPRLGLNSSKFTNDGIVDGQMEEYYSSKYRTSFTGGLELQHQLSDVFAGSIGVLYSRQGTDYERMADAKLSIKTDNILVPVLLVATTRIGLNLKAGIQPELTVHSNANNYLNKVNLSIPVGISYEWNNIALDVRYNIGVTKIYKDESSSDKPSHGSTFLITLGYGFDL